MDSRNQKRICSSNPLKCKSFVVACDPVCYLSNGFHLEIAMHIGIYEDNIKSIDAEVQCVEIECHGHKSIMQNIDCVHESSNQM